MNDGCSPSTQHSNYIAPCKHSHLILTHLLYRFVSQVARNSFIVAKIGLYIFLEKPKTFFLRTCKGVTNYLVVLCRK